MKKINTKKVLASLGAAGITLTAPLFAFAQGATQLDNLIGRVRGWVNSLVPIFMGIAFIYFVWGVITFIKAKEAEDKDKGRSTMINGIIGFAVIAALWGIIAFLTNATGISSGGNAPVAPTF